MPSTPTLLLLLLAASARCSAALIRAPLTRHDDATFIDVVREGLVRFEGLLSSLGGGDGDIVIKD
jgi:hypothetical protein